MKGVRFGMGILAVVLVGVCLLASQPVPGLAQSLAPEGRPDTARMRSNNVGYEVQNIYLQRGDGELHKLMESEASSEREVHRLVGEYSRTEKEAERAKIKSKLSEVLDKQFDLQQKRREMEVNQIEAQLKKLRELMRKRSEARQTIVDKRLDQLLRDAEGLGWTSPSGSGPYINRMPNINFIPQTLTAPQPQIR